MGFYHNHKEERQRCKVDNRHRVITSDCERCPSSDHLEAQSSVRVTLLHPLQETLCCRSPIMSLKFRWICSMTFSFEQAHIVEIPLATSLISHGSAGRFATVQYGPSVSKSTFSLGIFSTVPRPFDERSIAGL